MALSHSVRGRFGPSQFVSCEGHFVQRSNIFWEIPSSHSQSVNFRHFVMIWEFDSCANAFILIFLMFIGKAYHVGIQRETNRNSPRQFREGFLTLPLIKSGRSRPHQHTSKWLKHFVEWKISSIEPSGCQQDVEHEEAQFSSHRRSVVTFAVSDNSHPVPWEDCWRDFLGGLPRVSPKLKRLLHKVQCESSVDFVGWWSELRQRVSVEKQYCNLRVDDIIQFLHILHGWINVQWDLPFGSNSNVEVDVHELVMSVLKSASVLMTRLSFQRKQRGWIEKHTNCRNVHEGNCHLGFTIANFSLFRCPKNFSEDFLVCVFRSRKCGFSIGVMFPTIIVVRIFWNFHVEFNWKLVCRWWEGTWQGNMRVLSTFLFPNGEVGSFWMMVLGSLLEVIVLAGDLEHSWQCTVFDVMPIALQVSIDWCDLLNHMFWSLRWCVHVQAGFDRSSMVRLGCGFFDHFVDASQFFVSPKFWWWVLFWNFILFIKIRKQPHVVPTDCLFSANRSTHAHCNGNERMILDLGMDMTLRPATLLRWNFNFFVSRKPHLSHKDVGRAEHGSAHTMNHICILSSWHCRTQ